MNNLQLRAHGEALLTMLRLWDGIPDSALIWDAPRRTSTGGDGPALATLTAP